MNLSFLPSPCFTQWSKAPNAPSTLCSTSRFFNCTTSKDPCFLYSSPYPHHFSLSFFSSFYLTTLSPSSLSMSLNPQPPPPSPTPSSLLPSIHLSSRTPTCPFFKTPLKAFPFQLFRGLVEESRSTSVASEACVQNLTSQFHFSMPDSKHSSTILILLARRGSS